MMTQANAATGCSCRRGLCQEAACPCSAAGKSCLSTCTCTRCQNYSTMSPSDATLPMNTQSTPKTSYRNAFSSPSATRASTVSRSQGTPSSTKSKSPNTPAKATAASRLAAQQKKADVLLRREVCDCANRGCGLQGPCPCLETYGGCDTRCACKGNHIKDLSNSSTKRASADSVSRGCSCKKSNCLKLYCECLANQRVCDSRCRCDGCKNHAGHEKDRDLAIAQILERNPLAFQPKVMTGASRHLKGCNCRKSGCVKNYCECHQAGVACTHRCACHNCRNTGGHDAADYTRKSLRGSGDTLESYNAADYVQDTDSPSRFGGSPMPTRMSSRERKVGSKRSFATLSSDGGTVDETFVEGQETALPSVDSALALVYGETTSSFSLHRLCESLLTAAVAADSSGDTQSLDANEGVEDRAVTRRLLMDDSDTDDRPSDQEGMAQEREVLQEMSVWLRAMASRDSTLEEKLQYLASVYGQNH